MARINTVMGNTKRNLDPEFPEARDKAKRPEYSETAKTVKATKLKRQYQKRQ